jgi:multidrug efflux pump subunit AcrB
VRAAPLADDWRDGAGVRAGLAGMGKVQQQFFPDSSRPEVLVDIWFPEGTSLQANKEVTLRVEKRFCSSTVWSPSANG